MFGLLFISVSCSHKVDRFTLDRVVPAAMKDPDLGKICALGESLVHPLTAIPHQNAPPKKALVIAEAAAGICEQLSAQEHRLTALRLKQGHATVSSQRDARLLADRANRTAARRFYRSYQNTNDLWGPLGEACPKLSDEDEFTYLLGLVAGLNAIFADKQSGGEVAVPVNTLNQVGRAASCLDNETWWYAPDALQAAAWATIPGSGPDDVDPWELLEEAAQLGAQSGVRVARALQIVVAENADKDEWVSDGIKKHGASLSSTPTNPDWRLLDEYALALSLYASDSVWTSLRGHRTPRFGELPSGDHTPSHPKTLDSFGPIL